MRSRSAALAVALLLAPALVGSSGCIAKRLGQRVMNQANTLPELHYRQVLNNLALFADNPAALPWQVNFREGTTQVTDSGSGGAAVDLGPPAETLPQIFGSRTIVAQWGMTPVIDASELRLLRVAYRRALGSPDMPDPEFLNELAHELKNQLPSNADQRDESELFYEYQSRGVRNFAEFDARVTTTNDEEVCNGPEALASESVKESAIFLKILTHQDYSANMSPWTLPAIAARPGPNSLRSSRCRPRLTPHRDPPGHRSRPVALGCAPPAASRSSSAPPRSTN